MSLKISRPSGVLMAIVLSQFLCTSLWFAGNAIIDDLIAGLGFPAYSVSHLTSAIQFGFIVGTLAYALLNIADRYSPSRVFLFSALFASMSNIILAQKGVSFEMALGSRFLVGFFLAGIYPVGMKIAADHFDRSLGKSLGLLVGALVLGTALPHLIRSHLGDWHYSYVIFMVTGFAVIGGLVIGLMVPDGPYRKPSQKLQLRKTFTAFKNPAFRGAAFGYFGHMWELYTFYAFLPAILIYWSDFNESTMDISFWSFIFIGLGGVGCAFWGMLSQSVHPKILATIALGISGLICLLTPFIFGISMSMLFLVMIGIWGTTVAADSPMFSTLVAQNAIPELKGTALTIVNCLGFALTIVSIQLVGWLQNFVAFKYLFLVLGIGPLFGLINLWRTEKIKS